MIRKNKEKDSFLAVFREIANFENFEKITGMFNLKNIHQTPIFAFLVFSLVYSFNYISVEAAQLIFPFFFCREEILKKLLNGITLLRKLVERLFKSEMHEIQDALNITMLLLISIKVLIYLLFSLTLTPVVSIIIILLFFPISLKKYLIYDFREYLLTPILEKTIGYNYYRHNVLDVTTEEELINYYPNTKKGKLTFYLTYYSQKMFRIIYVFLIYLRLVLLSYPLSSLLARQGLFYFLIFNFWTLPVLLLSFLISFSRIFLLYSDLSVPLFYKNINDNFQKIPVDMLLEPTYKNAILIFFWSIRTLEDRDYFLKHCQSFSNREYLEEKIETHNLKGNLTFQEILLRKEFSAIFFLLFITLFYFLLTPELGELKLSIIIGFLSKESPLAQLPAYRRLLNHFCVLEKTPQADGGVKLSFIIFTTEKKANPARLVNLKTIPFDENIKGPAYITSATGNLPTIVVSKEESEEIELKCIKDYAEKENSVSKTFFETITHGKHFEEFVSEVLQNRPEVALNLKDIKTPEQVNFLNVKETGFFEMSKQELNMQNKIHQETLPEDEFKNCFFNLAKKSHNQQFFFGNGYTYEKYLFQAFGEKMKEITEKIDD